MCDVEEVGSKGWLIDATIVSETDSAVVESALYKGSSTSDFLTSSEVKGSQVKVIFQVDLKSRNQ